MTERALPTDTPGLGAGALPATAVVVCRNEAICIGRCLESLADFAEIVVVDSGSEDDTAAIVENYAERGFPIKLLRQSWLGYAKQKQFAIDRASRDWIFSLDADEWIDGELRAALPALLEAEPSLAGWNIRRVLVLNSENRRLARGMRPEALLRLVRRGRAHFDERQFVHEDMTPDGPVRTAPRGFLWHEREMSFRDQLEKAICYASLKAEQRVAEGKRPQPFKIFVGPPLYFARRLFRERAIVFGWDGVAHAAAGAVYSLSTEIMHYQLARRARRAP